MRKQLDKNLSFHKLVAYMIALMTGETSFFCWREIFPQIRDIYNNVLRHLQLFLLQSQTSFYQDN